MWQFWLISETHEKVQGSNLASPTMWDLPDEVVLENAHQISSNLLAINNQEENTKYVPLLVSFRYGNSIAFFWVKFLLSIFIFITVVSHFQAKRRTLSTQTRSTFQYNAPVTSSPGLLVRYRTVPYYIFRHGLFRVQIRNLLPEFGAGNLQILSGSLHLPVPVCLQ
jgi:hypothetical protein